MLPARYDDDDSSSPLSLSLYIYIYLTHFAIVLFLALTIIHSHLIISFFLFFRISFDHQDTQKYLHFASAATFPVSKMLILKGRKGVIWWRDDPQLSVNIATNCKQSKRPATKCHLFFFLNKLKLISLVSRVFANGQGDWGSIPDCVIPKTQKMVLDTSLLNTQLYKVWIKGKVEQSKERISAPS